MAVLALNCGSSSLKFGFYEHERDTLKLLCEGEAEEIGRDTSSFWVSGRNGRGGERAQIQFPDHARAFVRAMDALNDWSTPQPQAVGHRFVHGGPRVREHKLATTAVIENLRDAVSFAPLHVPQALSVLEAAQQRFPQAAQVICLDTAFHRTMPDVSKTFALPANIRNMGVERYGFHGLSVESILAQLHPIPDRLIVAHLGNGASITAIRDGKSMDTTMGLTPTGGVMMGTRCGDLDPGVVLYLMRNGSASAENLEELLDHRSGLLGVSEKSNDVRILLNLRSHDDRADLALRMFCYQVRKAIVAMAAALGGVEALVFTGGIGEHATELREEICSGLEFLGSFQVMVLPAQEDLQIARITARLAAE